MRAVATALIAFPGAFFFFHSDGNGNVIYFTIPELTTTYRVHGKFDRNARRGARSVARGTTILEIFDTLCRERLMMMLKQMGKIRLGLACLLALLLIATIPGMMPTGGAPGQASAAEDDYRQVVVVYASDCKGKIEPCG